MTVTALMTPTLPMNISLADKKHSHPESQNWCSEFDKLGSELQQERDLRETEEHLIAMLVHDLKTSLSVIQISCGFIEAATESASREPVIKHLATVKKQLAFITRLAADLSAVVQTHHHPTPEIANGVNLKLLVENCWQVLALNQQDTSRLSITTSGDPENLTTDVNILRSVLTNLLSNAIKYSPAKSLIRLEMHGTAENIMLCIRDKGIGIPLEELEKVFDPFYRASNALKFEGSGLGLALAKSGVEMLGGSLGVESKLNEGTVFTILLPRVSS